HIPLPPPPLSSASVPAIVEAFHQTYERLYRRINRTIPIEVLNWRLIAKAPDPLVPLRPEPVQRGLSNKEALKGNREAYFSAYNAFVPCPIYDRYALRPGMSLQGPAIIEERESTTVLGPGDNATIDAYRNLVIEIGGM
ncbi:MAG: hydantoinase/oxoprolinase family protein, partial [Nitrospinota bacterium]